MSDRPAEVADSEGEGAGRSVGPDRTMLRDRASAELGARFGGALDNEVMAEIFRVGVEIRAAILAAAEVK